VTAASVNPLELEDESALFPAAPFFEQPVRAREANNKRWMEDCLNRPNRFLMMSVPSLPESIGRNCPHLDDAINDLGGEWVTGDRGDWVLYGFPL
jgi:hypothetical protein